MTEAAGKDPFAALPSAAQAVDYGKFGFTAKRFILYEHCEHAAAVVPAREPPHPALACFQVRAGKAAGLRVAATDMERTVITWTEAATPEGVDGLDYAEAYIPARRLLAILREVPEGDVRVRVSGNKAAVTAANGYSADLRLPGAWTYPKLPDPGELDFLPYGRVKLLAALRSVRHAVCKDPSLSNLTQVAITKDGSGESVITAADGSRLARAGLPGFPLSAAVPAAVLADLARLLAASPEEGIEVAQDAKLVAFRAGPVMLAAQKRTSPFPDVDAQQLKPALLNDQVLAADKAALQAAIRRVRINADSGTAAIALQVSSGHVTVLSRDKDGNSAREDVAAEWDGPERLVVVSHVALDDALAAHPGASCLFRLGKDVGKRRSMVLLEGGGLVQVMTQLPPALVGY